jgi:hypothetical protein
MYECISLPTLVSMNCALGIKGVSMYVFVEDFAAKLPQAPQLTMLEY